MLNNSGSSLVNCPWEPSTLYIFSSNVPDLVHYSHGVAGLAAILTGLVIYFSNPKGLLQKFFLLFSVAVTLWIFLDLILWATNKPSVVMFNWSMQVFLESITFALAVYIMYTFFENKLPGKGINFFIFILLVPIILFLPTNLTLDALILEYCEAEEGLMAAYYSYFVNLSLLLLLSAITYKKISKATDIKRKYVAIYLYVGLVSFLVLFVSGNLISTITEDWTISQYGLFGLPIFSLLIGYAIVKYQAFNLKVAGSQFLVALLIMSVGSLLFVVQSDLSRIIAFLTLLITAFAGLLLVNSVKKEIRQREEIERLANDLEKTNERLQVLDKQKSEFVSIASHQLRSPLTAIRGYVSMIQEGTFGQMPEALHEPLKRIEDSGKFMAASIDDFLNVSRIESGSMKYEYTNVNLVEMTKRVVEDLQAEAAKRELLLLYKTNLIHKNSVVNADPGKVNQILHNLINNALKYTIRGTVTVYVHDNPASRILTVDIIDTGIGMSEETVTKLFGKFARAKIASSANIMGTGLGLFVAREMARAMKGEVSANSEGEGKGSKFTFTMPYEPTVEKVKTEVRE